MFDGEIESRAKDALMSFHLGFYCEIIEGMRCARDEFSPDHLESGEIK